MLHGLTTPVVQGEEGRKLPGLLGLKSLESQRAILDMGSRKLILPGPAGVKYDIPPGSISIPLEKAPSGHLVMVIDSYEKLKRGTGSVPPRTVNLTAFRTGDAHDEMQRVQTPTPPASPRYTPPPRTGRAAARSASGTSSGS